jgi:hypothetical protein
LLYFLFWICSVSGFWIPQRCLIGSSSCWVLACTANCLTVFLFGYMFEYIRSRGWHCLIWVTCSWRSKLASQDWFGVLLSISIFYWQGCRAVSHCNFSS